MARYFSTFLVLLSVFSVCAQSKNIESLKKTINESEVSLEKRILAFSEIIKKDTTNRSFQVILNEVVSQPDHLSNKFRSLLEVAYLFEKSKFQKLIQKSNNILLEEKCTDEDSIWLYTSIFISYDRLGYYKNATDYILKVVEIQKKNNDFKKTQLTYSMWGSMAYRQKKYGKAISYYQKSFDLQTSYEEYLYPYSMLNNLGLSYHHNRNNDSALICFEKIITHMENAMPDSLKSPSSDFFLGLVYGNIGDVYLSHNELNKAEPFLLYDLDQSKKAGEKENTCITQMNLAELYQKMGNYELTKNYLDQAQRLIEKNHFRNIKRRILLLYAQYYQLTGEFEESAKYYGVYTALNDSISTEILERKTIDLEMEYDLFKKGKELEVANISAQNNLIELNAKTKQLYIVLIFSVLLLILLGFIVYNYRIKVKFTAKLAAKNNEIEIHGEKLEKALFEKDLLVKEIHHRVKNNLQMVISLLRLQANESDNKNISNAFEESINRLNSMALIHQDLYQKDNIKDVQLKSYYENLIEQISGSFVSQNSIIICENNIQDIKLTIDKAIPIGLIVNEIITNSFKHAFKEQKEGTITSNLDKNGNTITLILKDNGSGLPKNKIESRSSFGITLIDLLVEQIDGEIKAYNDNGAVFEIQFMT